MERYATRRFVLAVGVVGLVTGMLLGAALVAGAPAEAGAGDAVILGVKNTSAEMTKVKATGRRTLKIINTTGKGIPLILWSAEDRPPMKVNSTARVRRLNADRLDGWHAAALGARVATAGPIEVGPVCGGFDCSAELLSTTIEVPRSGMLIVGAGADFARYTGGDDALACKVLVAEDQPMGGEMGIHLNSEQNDSNQEENCIITAWHPVTAGTHTVSFMVSGVRDSQTRIGRGGALWVLWAPIDGSTGQPFDH